MDITKALNEKALEAAMFAAANYRNSGCSHYSLASKVVKAYAAALSAQGEAAQPAAEGWVLVPREPTKEMIEAGRLAANRVFTDLGFTDPDDERIGTQAHNRKCARACYIAAVAASPNAASQDGGREQ